MHYTSKKGHKYKLKKGKGRDGVKKRHTCTCKDQLIDYSIDEKRIFFSNRVPLHTVTDTKSHISGRFLCELNAMS